MCSCRWMSWSGPAAGGMPWEEDRWADLHMAPLDFKAVMPCDRCRVRMKVLLTGCQPKAGGGSPLVCVLQA